jgi:hypothetical protein
MATALEAELELAVPVPVPIAVVVCAIAEVETPHIAMMEATTNGFMIVPQDG